MRVGGSVLLISITEKTQILTEKIKIILFVKFYVYPYKGKVKIVLQHKCSGILVDSLKNPS